MITHTLALPGCTPEPLMNYLKALGVLRLVSTSSQGDADVRASWRDGVFTLQTRMDVEGLVRFFLDDYAPTPVVVPWSGSDFFAVTRTAQKPTFKKTPTSSDVIAAFLATEHPRLASYRAAITLSLQTLKAVGIVKKEQMEGAAKSRFIASLRSSSDEAVTDWIDAAAVLEKEKPIFTAMLGSGGGSDGNTHFSDNFMQNIWDVFSEFDEQRVQKKSPRKTVDTGDVSGNLLRHALFSAPTENLVVKRTSSLFDGGAVAGANAGHGLRSESLGNPWNFILTLEGAICFAGALSRRTGSRGKAQSAFPFQVQASPTAGRTVVEKEQDGRELWLPIWERPTSLPELLHVLREGRMETGNGHAASGVDAARAVAALGVDRGLVAFQRYAIVRGRVGGENYNTAASLGVHPVKSRRDVDLIREFDRWLSIFRSQCMEENEEDRYKASARFTGLLRNLERSIFNYCRHGGRSQFQAVLIALGRAEAAIASAPSFQVSKKTGRVVPPLAGLSADWIAAADDDSAEYEIALALAGIGGGEGGRSVRRNLEPFTIEKGRAAWAEKERAVVWNAADLSTNLAAVLARRLMDGARRNDDATSGAEPVHPLESIHTASLEAVAAFLTPGVLDEERIADLLWGLTLIDTSRETYRGQRERRMAAPLPRAYALLKLLAVPFALAGEAGDVDLSLEPALLALLRAGRVGDACAIAARRLRAKGFLAMPHRRAGRGEEAWAELPRSEANGRRLAAALLIPISYRSALTLRDRVLRPREREAQLI